MNSFFYQKSIPNPNYVTSKVWKPMEFTFDFLVVSDSNWSTDRIMHRFLLFIDRIAHQQAKLQVQNLKKKKRQSDGIR